MPLGGGSCLRRTGHPFAVSDPGGPSQKIESGFAASPETIRREPRDFDLRRSVGNRQDLAACALCDLLFFPRRRFLGRRSLVIFCGHEVPFFPIYGEQIRDHLSSYGQSRSIGIPFLLFCFIDQSQIMILSGRQLCGFHQQRWIMFVALFGLRGARHLRRSKDRREMAQNSRRTTSWICNLSFEV